MPALVDAAVPRIEQQLPGLVERNAPRLVDSLVPVVRKKVPVLVDAAWPPIERRLQSELESAIQQNVPFASQAKKYGSALALGLTGVVVGASLVTLARAVRDGI